ncbi:MAG: ribonuclease HI [Holosporales bacterium]|jgi:ribonuclease HI|nr:ribonuclease HI [Holosporales bacterium]
MKSSFEIVDMECEDFFRDLKEGDKIEIYTDGSCLGNPGPGGWAGVFIFHDKRSNISGYEKETTNNRMELIAAIESIKAVPKYVSITLFTDSTYVKNGITQWIGTWEKNNWRSSSGKSVRNQDLWVNLVQIVKERQIEWLWVKGHADCANNNNADFIARSAIVTSYMDNTN